MKKTGRNDPCPCGSGLKYKKCCQLTKPRASAEAPPEQKVFVTSEIARLQQHAATKRHGLKLFGSLLFFATGQGDAWVLELVEQDALRVSRGGQSLPVKISETEDNLEIGWTHSFIVKGAQFITTAYLDGSVETYHNCPVTVIKDAQEKLKREYSSRELAALRTVQG